MTIKHIYSPNALCTIHVIRNNYITYQIKNSAVKLINCIQNKSLCLHNICVCTVCVHLYSRGQNYWHHGKYDQRSL